MRRALAVLLLASSCDLADVDEAARPDATTAAAPETASSDPLSATSYDASRRVMALRIGRLDLDGTFAPLVDGAALEIVQGPQGGIHLEVAIEVRPTGAASLDVDLLAAAHLADAPDGRPLPASPVLIGALAVSDYPLELDGECYRSAVIPIFLNEVEASKYASRPATVSITLTVAQSTLRVERRVLLVDAL